MLRAVWTKFDRDWGWNLARMIAYACLSGLFAVLGFQLAILSIVLRLTSDTTEQHVIAQILRFLPDRVTDSAILSFANGLESAPWFVVVLVLVVATWYGSRFFAVLEGALCIIFRRPKRPFLLQNRAAVLMLLLFALLLPIIALSATITPHLGTAATYGPHATADLARLGDDPLFAGIILVAGLAADLLFLLVAYTELTPGGVSVADALPGAAIGAVLAQSYLLLFPFYVRDVLHPSQFGSVAGFALVALVFFFAYAIFIIVGAELASLRAGYRAKPREITAMLAEPLPAGHEETEEKLEPALPARQLRPVIRSLPSPQEFSWGEESLRLVDPPEALR